MVRKPLASLVAAPLLLVASSAHAHGLDAGRFTLELDGSVVRVVGSPRSRSFAAYDDNQDGLLDLNEVRAHRGQIRAVFEAAFRLRDTRGQVARCEDTDVSTPGSGLGGDRLPAGDHVRVTRLCRFEQAPAGLVLSFGLDGAAPMIVEAVPITTLGPGRREVVGAPERVVVNDDGGEARVLAPAVQIDAQKSARAAEAWSFFSMGVRHVAEGLDHLLFIATLLLSARSLRQLGGAVTAFTITHTAALALVVTGVVAAPSSRLVEPLIALSITASAAVTLLRRGQATGALLPALFGVVHGLGLAGSAAALFEGAPGAMLAPFTLGAEVAQMGAAFAGFALVGRMPAVTQRRWAAWALSVVGLVWCALRVGGAA